MQLFTFSRLTIWSMSMKNSKRRAASKPHTLKRREIRWVIASLKWYQAWLFVCFINFIIINPLTPGTFCKKMFLDILLLLSWISVKLALIRLKMHLQHNSLPFWHQLRVLPHCDSGMHRNQISRERKWPMSLGFSIFGIFFLPSFFVLFFSFCCSDWPSTGLACR